ncbi:MAG: bifunctional UDP-N-acetylglucosamine diphosphorylase/glucosamine-1-phosphate N-acetyltransferase GlmU [Thermotogota bacterium]|nr:bifunctional UDP-N-acetylglucosamine diphosphorylase/glucosamine-1-phosphate N-acetyltransferase GlmU [Thermotogota bacterium]
MIAIVLAAGLGKRMKSEKPKVMHDILGVPMVLWVLKSLRNAGIDYSNIYVVTGYKSELVKEILPEGVNSIEQKDQLGTGHAVLVALEEIDKNEDILVLNGDVPLIRQETIMELKNMLEFNKQDAVVLTMKLDEPSGYGRILKSGKGLKIIEDADADSKTKRINEVNAGIYGFKYEFISEAIKQVDNNNEQGEYYLPDVFNFSGNASTLIIGDNSEVSGINNRVQLAEVQKIAQKRINEKHMYNGVTIIDPENTYIGPDVKIGKDSIIQPMTFISGCTEIGTGCLIGPMTRINESFIDNEVEIIRSEVDKATIEKGSKVGPYSRLRPGAYLQKNVKVGNYVEIKKSKLGEGSKAQHLTYLGDSEIGKDVNIGAGTITCNYDGVNKHKTVIEDNSFIGSNSSIVAPVVIGRNSVVGAGSTITENVEAYSLALGRGRQVVKKGRYRKDKSEEGEK